MEEMERKINGENFDSSTVHPKYLSVRVHQILKLIAKWVVFLMKNIIFLSFIIIMINLIYQKHNEIKLIFFKKNSIITENIDYFLR